MPEAVLGHHRPAPRRGAGAGAGRILGTQCLEGRDNECLLATLISWLATKKDKLKRSAWRHRSASSSSRWCGFGMKSERLIPAGMKAGKQSGFGGFARLLLRFPGLDGADK